MQIVHRHFDRVRSIERATNHFGTLGMCGPEMGSAGEAVLYPAVQSVDTATESHVC